MNSPQTSLTVGYVAKMFPRLSETFVLNEILELERQGVRVVVFSAKKPNEGKFHPQLARLQAEIIYLEDLDPRKWVSWLGPRWDALSVRSELLWELVEEGVVAGEIQSVETAWLGAWVALRCEELGVDRLHAHFATLPSTIAYMAHRVGGIPFSFTAHAKDIFVYEPGETKLAAKIEAAEFMITVTDYNKRHITNLLPDTDPEKIRVLHNGIDLTTFTPRDDSKRDASLILGVGRLVPKKGFETLIRACAELSSQGVPFRCVIAGDGPEHDVLKALIQDLGLQERITLMGSVTHDRVLELMGQCGVFCLPCTTAADNNLDALPTVLLEALATGTPSISTCVSGIPEIIDSEVNGVLVEPDDPRLLASALADILRTPDRRRSYAGAARAKAEREFDIATNVGRLRQMFLRGGLVESDPAPATRTAQHSTKCRALYVCADRGIPFGGNKGAAIHVREFAEALHRAGYETTVAVARRARKASYIPSYAAFALSDTDTELLPHESGSANDTLHAAIEFSRQQPFYGLLSRIVARKPMDLVCERYSLYGLSGLVLAQKLGIPFVLEVNSPLVDEAVEHRGLEDASLARSIEAHLFRSSNHVFVVSERLREHVLTIAPDAAITVLPNGVDTDRFKPDLGKARSTVLEASDEDLLIGFVGRVRPWHGLEDLIDAFTKVARMRSEVRLCVIGNTDGASEALMARLGEHGMTSRVTFTGEIAARDMPSVMGGLDIVVAPYPAMDSFYFSPLKVYEYMASGRAIVASGIGQISDVLEHGQTGLLYKPGDVQELSEALLLLVDNSELRRELGEQARTEAVAKHTWQHRVEMFQSVVQGHLATADRGPKHAIGT